MLPLHVQVLDQEARDDHPHPVVHPAGRPAAAACPASTIGKPVRPSRHASSRSPGSSYAHRARTRGGGTRARCRAAGTARRRRTRARRAPCGSVAAPLPVRPSRSASIVRGWISPHLRCRDIRLVRVEVGPVALVVVVAPGARRRRPPSARARSRLAGLGQRRARRAARARGCRRCRPAPARCAPVGASTGSRQPCSSQPRENGV